MNFSHLPAWIGAAVVACLAQPVWAVPGDQASPHPESPNIAAASEEGQQALGGFRIPAGLQAELWAAEPALANPVAFCFDHRGRVYVCETFRQGRGVEDNRGHAHWLDDDLAAQTVEDRLAYIHKHLGEQAVEYTRHDDRVRLLEDTDGDGRADQNSIFAQHFNQILDGTAAGVLAYRGDVFLTCIPHLWLLRDKDGDGQAEERKSLQYGYGVRFAFRGHDMHGLAIGPDGRLYFSIGDRGLNVQQGDRHFAYPEAGAVMRCEFDGSNLEMFAMGLRNPQELAFDDYGNLFTGDNNSDSGDKARFVHVVEGGDSGWRMAYQYLPDRGPFNREKIWHPANPDQPAYLVPPVTNFADGPSGLAYYPGTGLPEHFRSRLLLADFRGGPANSGIRSFRVNPKGATFELVDAEETIWNVLATDVDFGPDGAIYVTDWVNGWNGEGKGRIYRFRATDEAVAARAKETQQLLNAGFAERSSEELIALLAHADRRVRQEAQFALVDKQASAALVEVARSNGSQFARLHAIWGLGQLVRRQIEQAACLNQIDGSLTGDPDAEVRAAAARVLGDVRHEPSGSALRERLHDDSSRVRAAAAIALGKLRQPASIAPLLTLLAENGEADPVLRHAAVMGLAGSANGSADELAKHSPHDVSARMGVLLALRRLSAEQVASFLNDVDPRLVVEAARAVHDLPIPAALPQLAALVGRETNDDALIRRVLNANYRLGGAQNAAAIAAYAGRGNAPEAMRLEALEMLAAWAKPSNRDRVLGMWRPLAERSGADAASALRANLPAVFTGPDKVRAKAAQVAADLGIREVVPELQRLLADKAQPPQTRADALVALGSLKFADLEPAARAALGDDAATLRAAARTILVQREAADAIALLEQALAGEKVERQAALAVLAELKSPESTEVISRLLNRLLAGDFPADSELDLVAAAERSDDAVVKPKLAEFAEKQSTAGDLAGWQTCLEGGDADRGRKLFLERTQLSCVRCHKVGGTGGEVGPDLSRIAIDKSREYLLESIVLPNKAIAKNFETIVILDVDGKQHSGILKSEDARQVTLLTPEAKVLTIPLDQIEARKTGKSSMPEDLTKHLNKFELRDLVEFLATLNADPPPAAGESAALLVPRNIEGWTCHIDPQLLEGEHAALGEETLRIVANQLFELKLLMSRERVLELQKVEIRLDRAYKKLEPAQYHPSDAWLREHGHDVPTMHRRVHVPNAHKFTNRRHLSHQPCVMLHELAHAYHDQVLGFDHPAVKARYEAAKEAGIYKSVLHIDGNEREHYALTNHHEFFAEMTEAYFGTNDFYPFVRAELKRYDPETYRLLEGIWGEVGK